MENARRLLHSNSVLGTHWQAQDIWLYECQTIEGLLALMSQEEKIPRRAWGGNAEIFVMAHRWKWRICAIIVRDDLDAGLFVRLLQGPAGDRRHVVCLLCSGTHFGLLVLDEQQLAMLGLSCGD